MKKVLAVALVLVLAIGCFAGCGAQKKIIGSWKNVNSEVVGSTLTFNEDGTGKMDASVLDIDLGSVGDLVDSLAGIDMKYTVDGKTLTVSYSVNVIGISLGDTTKTYTVSFSGDNMKLTGEDGTVKDFVRVTE